MYKKGVSVIYILLFIWGYFGAFSSAADKFNQYLENVQAPAWLNGELIVELLLTVITVCVYIKDVRMGIKEFKEIDINEIATVFMVIAVLSVIITYIFNYGESVIQQSSLTQNLKGTFWITSVICAPVFEELLCRCGIMEILDEQLKLPSNISMVVSALFFALLHLIKQNDVTINIAVRSLILYLLLGLACAYLHKKTGNVFSAIILHVLWNMSVVAGCFIRARPL